MISDTDSLFQSCRRGDLARVRYLVEERDVELNVRDQWDSTPLYYSCLCGHEDLVLYLLQQGATCQASTFDGERCVYGALTDRIRAMLLDSSVVTAHSMRRDAYSEFLRNLFSTGSGADVRFNLCDGSEFLAHRCLLMARSPYFKRNFSGKWIGRRQVSVRSPRIDSDSFRALLQYLYTGRVEIRLDRLDSLLRLADKTELEELRARLLQRQSGLDGLRAAKPGMRVTTIVLDPDMDQVKRDLTFLADQATPLHLLPEAESDRISCYPDLCLEAESSSEDSVDSPDVASRQFRCHRAFVCGRSDYFRAAVDSELSDADWLADGVRHLRLRCLSFGELASVVAYVYSDQLVISRDDDLDDSSSFAAILALMSAADLLLLPGLKRLCAGRLETRLDCDNVADVLRLSRLMRLPRLED
uniref:Ankyrin repeat and BTB/POZ domain-containing protein 1 n=1 Tax=Macrostomum lignano TaxID=282301 RepID=A0A1I8IAY2_9PLAT